MKPFSSGSGLRDISRAVRQTADLRRLCLSLREAKSREIDSRLGAEFEQVVSKSGGSLSVDSRMLEVGLRDLWRNGQYDRIVEVARRLPARVLQGNEAALMYHSCAVNRRDERASTVENRE